MAGASSSRSGPRPWGGYGTRDWTWGICSRMFRGKNLSGHPIKRQSDIPPGGAAIAMRGLS
ncbi:protein of unknown function [Magnetospirillum sp. XM-1]|nr:protein of unknown function [Magnetospirillum sp. XM-1]